MAEWGVDMKNARSAARLGRPARVPGEKPTRQRIFEAALELFSERGYDRTSVRQIASAVGLTESAVYRHYSGKEDLLEAILSHAESQVFAPLPDVTDGESGGSIFRRLLSAPLDTIAADPYLVKIVRILYAEMHHNEKIRTYFQREYVRRADDLLEALFAGEIARGTLQDCDARALAVVFNAFRSEWAFQSFIVDRETPFDVERLKKDLEAPIRLFERLLGADGKQEE